MATLLQGHTFAATEQVTNTKLHNLVANASISNILAAELSNNLLTSLASALGKIPPQNFANLNTPATNASLIDVSTRTALLLYYSTYGSLATFINARVGQEFLLIAQQASFPTILDGGAFRLAGNWIPDTAGDNLRLIWDGTNFTETARGNV